MVIAMVEPIANALQEFAKAQLAVQQQKNQAELESEREKNQTERLKLAVANRTNIGIFGIAVFLLTLAGVALFKDKDVLVQTLSSLVVGMLAGFGIGYGVKK